jgi:hypothetical protein
MESKQNSTITKCLENKNICLSKMKVLKNTLLFHKYIENSSSKGKIINGGHIDLDRTPIILKNNRNTVKSNIYLDTFKKGYMTLEDVISLAK